MRKINRGESKPRPNTEDKERKKERRKEEKVVERKYRQKSFVRGEGQNLENEIKVSWVKEGLKAPLVLDSYTHLTVGWTYQ